MEKIKKTNKKEENIIEKCKKNNSIPDEDVLKKILLFSAKISENECNLEDIRIIEENKKYNKFRKEDVNIILNDRIKNIINEKLIKIGDIIVFRGKFENKINEQKLNIKVYENSIFKEETMKKYLKIEKEISYGEEYEKEIFSVIENTQEWENFKEYDKKEVEEVKKIYNFKEKIKKEVIDEIKENLEKINTTNNVEELAKDLCDKYIDKKFEEFEKDNNEKIKLEIGKVSKEFTKISNEETIKVNNSIKSLKNNINKKIDNVDKKINDFEEKMEKLEEEINNSKKIIIKSSDNLLKEKYSKDNKINYIKNSSKEEKNKYIDNILKYLYSKEGLKYEKMTIKQFYSAMCTNQMLVLSGAPGTGKTSLVEGFCKATGINKKIISVQPNWHENQDIIGFYNPLEKMYVSTPLIDFILEADKNPNELYLVCFDEMNLAQTEYYLSEFLSKLETKEKIIELYSDEVYESNKESSIEILKFIINNYSDISFDIVENMKDEDILNITYKDFKELNFETFEKFNFEKTKLMNYLIYGNKIKIPKNIRFCGTINKDETTKDLSPKVIDRSIIMEVKKSSNQKIEIDKNAKPLNLSSKCFEVKENHLDDAIIDRLKNIKDIVLKELYIELNNRFDKHIKEIRGSEIFEDGEFIDMILLMKVVPKINTYIEPENYKKVDTIEKTFENNPETLIIYDKMKEYWKENEILTFWR